MDLGCVVNLVLCSNARILSGYPKGSFSKLAERGPGEKWLKRVVSTVHFSTYLHRTGLFSI